MKQARADWLKERNHLKKQAELEKEEVRRLPNRYTPLIPRGLLAQMRLQLEKKREHEVGMLNQQLFSASKSQEEAEAHSAALKEEQKA